MKLFTWNYLQKYFIKQDNLTVTPEEATAEAKALAQAQFAQYGMLSVPEDVLDNYAKDMLKNKQTLQNIIDRAVEEKLAAWLKRASGT